MYALKCPPLSGEALWQRVNRPVGANLDRKRKGNRKLAKVRRYVGERED